MAQLFIYNPTCDMAVENGTYSYMPPKQLQLFETEIAPIMIFLGNSDDCLLVKQHPDKTYLDFWQNIDNTLPSFIVPDELKEAHPFKEIIPWGWSQIITKLCGQLHTQQNYLPVFYDSSSKHFFSRITSVKLLERLAQYNLPDFISIPQIPIIINNYSEIEPLFSKYQNGIVLKTLWSSSGRGTCFIRQLSDLKLSESWINATLNKHKALIAEPIYPKVQDASMQFIITPEKGYRFLGINYFDADEQGRFAKEYLHVPSSVNSIMNDKKDQIKQLAVALGQAMREEQIHEHYQGPIGIDVLFFTTPEGNIALYPLVEANLRCNMGLVNMYLKKKIHPTSRGTWQIQRFKKGEALQLFIDYQKQYPLRLENGKISSGFLPLTPLTADTTFGAWGIITSS